MTPSILSVGSSHPFPGFLSADTVEADTEKEEEQEEEMTILRGLGS